MVSFKFSKLPQALCWVKLLQLFTGIFVSQFFVTPALTRELIPYTKEDGGYLCNNNEQQGLQQAFRFQPFDYLELFPTFDGKIKFDESKRNKIFNCQFHLKMVFCTKEYFFYSRCN